MFPSENQQLDKSHRWLPVFAVIRPQMLCEKRRPRDLFRIQLDRSEHKVLVSTGLVNVRDATG